MFSEKQVVILHDAAQLKELDNLQLEFEVLNALITPGKNPRVIVSTKI